MISEKQKAEGFYSRLHQPDKKFIGDIVKQTNIHKQSQTNNLLHSVLDSSSTHTASGFISPPYF